MCRKKVKKDLKNRLTIVCYQFYFYLHVILLSIIFKIIMVNGLRCNGFKRKIILIKGKQEIYPIDIDPTSIYYFYMHRNYFIAYEYSIYQKNEFDTLNVNRGIYSGI